MMPDMDDDKGTSLVLIHSEKGQVLLDSIKGNLILKPCDTDIIETHNPSVTSSVQVPKIRNKFFSIYLESDFDVFVNRLTKENVYRRLRHFASKIKHRLIK